MLLLGSLLVPRYHIPLATFPVSLPLTKRSQDLGSLKKHGFVETLRPLHLLKLVPSQVIKLPLLQTNILNIDLLEHLIHEL